MLLRRLRLPWFRSEGDWDLIGLDHLLNQAEDLGLDNSAKHISQFLPYDSRDGAVELGYSS